VPAPWIQINLLKLLALLGADDQAASEHMYEVLLQAMQRAEKYKNNAGYAVLYEAIMSTTRIRANNALLEAAANSIGQLIRVRNHNLKYLGIQALAAIVRVAPRFVTPHQMEVIECLESTDESIKRKTLDLLYRMTNTKNVVVIVAKLIEYLQNTVATDELVRAELVSRINELAERYAPNNHWYIDTMNVMLQVGGSHVRPEVAYNLIRLISQESDNSEQENIQLRHYAVSAFLKSLESGESLPDIQVQVALHWAIPKMQNCDLFLVGNLVGSK
jgi:AP-4 complex subunit epsilon-1